MPVAAFDIIIRGGTVYNGSGKRSRRADVGVLGDRIAAIGDLGQAEARTVIDASGLAVAPGFIDIHTHSEFFSLLAPGAESKVTSGVTTELLGNCGGSAFPLRGEAKERSQETYSDYGLRIDWEDIDGYFTYAGEVGCSVNRASLTGHGTLRALTVGYDDKPPTRTQMEQMKRELADCLERGSVGLSSGLIYPPGCYARTEELIELARVAAGYDALYASHVRGEGTTGVAAIAEHLRISREAGIRSEIAHIKCAGQANWGNLPRYLELITEAQAQGVDVAADRYPYVASSTSLASVFPEWLHAGGIEAELGRLRDPATREQLRQAIRDQHGAGEEDYWQSVLVSYVSCAERKHLEGLRVAEVGERVGKAPVDAVMDLLLAERSKVSAIFFSMSEENLKQIYSWPFVMIGSDAGVRSSEGPTRAGKPHPRSFGTPARFLGRYVREAKVVSLSEGVRKLTSLPAERIGLRKRGWLKKGYFADIVVFDPETVADRATFADPFQYSVGFAEVLVNGVAVIRAGRHTGARPGRILRRGE
jgi:N-acyl-D-amino-acid deacylase